MQRQFRPAKNKEMINVKKLLFCRNVGIIGSLATAVFHFVCCGLPTILVLLNGVLNLTDIPHFSILSHHQMGYMLVFSGALLALSFALALWGKCSCHQKGCYSASWVILYVSLLLYLTALFFHFHPIH